MTSQIGHSEALNGRSEALGVLRSNPESKIFERVIKKNPMVNRSETAIEEPQIVIWRHEKATKGPKDPSRGPQWSPRSLRCPQRRPNRLSRGPKRPSKDTKRPSKATKKLSKGPKKLSRGPKRSSKGSKWPSRGPQ